MFKWNEELRSLNESDGENSPLVKVFTLLL